MTNTTSSPDSEAGLIFGDTGILASTSPDIAVRIRAGFLPPNSNPGDDSMRLARLIGGCGHGWGVPVGEDQTSVLVAILNGRPVTLTDDDWEPENLRRREILLEQAHGRWEHYTEVAQLGPDHDTAVAFYAPRPNWPSSTGHPNPQAAAKVVEGLLAEQNRADRRVQPDDPDLWTELRRRLTAANAELPKERCS